MFKKTIITSVDIDVPVSQLWHVVGALEQYADWNSATVFSAPAREGRIQLMRVKLGWLWLPVPVLIKHCDPQNGLRWTGGIPLLITGSHFFRAESLGNNQSRLVQGEDFSGLLVPVLLPLLNGVLNSLYAGVNSDIRGKLTQLAVGI